MKTLIASLLIVAAAVIANAQDSQLKLSSLDHLAAKASNAVDVNIDGRLVRLALGVFDDKDEEEQKIKKLLAGIKGVYVRNFEFESEGQYTAADLEAIRAQLRGPGWTRMVDVKSKKEGNLEVYVLLNGEQVAGLTVLSSETRELTVVNIVGPVDLDKLADLEGRLGIPELGIESKKSNKKNDEQ
jgi:hypothetical protein